MRIVALGDLFNSRTVVTSRINSLFLICIIHAVA